MLTDTAKQSKFFSILFYFIFFPNYLAN